MNDVCGYDRQGNEVSFPEWCALVELGGWEYKKVKRTAIDELGLDVSTVWLGLDHSFGAGGPPLIFETMIFAQELSHAQYEFKGKTRKYSYHEDVGYCKRYATEEEAVADHDRVVAEFRKGIDEVKELTDGSEGQSS